MNSFLLDSSWCMLNLEVDACESHGCTPVGLFNGVETGKLNSQGHISSHTHTLCDISNLNKFYIMFENVVEMHNTDV